jgi:hypothetical protein
MGCGVVLIALQCDSPAKTALVFVITASILAIVANMTASYFAEKQ